MLDTEINLPILQLKLPVELKTKELPLRNSNQVTIIDEDNYERLKDFTWTLLRGYPRRTNNGVGDIFLHHEVIGRQQGNIVVDHIDNNPLNNTRLNLRFVTKGANRQRSKPPTNSSGFRGVSYHKLTGKWQGEIRFNNERFNLGLYRTPEEAALAYDEKAREFYGVTAATNY